MTTMARRLDHGPLKSPGHAAIVRALVAAGKADMDSKSIDHRTPLSYAAAGGNEALVKVLLATEKVVVDSDDGKGVVCHQVLARRGCQPAEIARRSTRRCVRTGFGSGGEPESEMAGALTLALLCSGRKANAADT